MALVAEKERLGTTMTEGATLIYTSNPFLGGRPTETLLVLVNTHSLSALFCPRLLVLWSGNCLRADPIWLIRLMACHPTRYNTEAQSPTGPGDGMRTSRGLF